MRSKRLLAVLLAAVTGALTAAGVVVAAPSWAGGPTSVLLVNPETGRVAALYATDARYERLSDLVGASFGASSPNPQPVAGGAGADPGAGGISVTWLVHDVQVWRVDRVLVDGAGHVSIATQENLSGGSIWDVQPVTHPSSNPRDLVALLDGLGLRAPGAPAFASSPAAPVRSAAPAPHDPTAVGTARAASAPGTPAALWALAGAALGAALVWTALRVIPARGSRGSRGEAQAADADEPELSPSADVISSGR